MNMNDDDFIMPKSGIFLTSLFGFSKFEREYYYKKNVKLINSKLERLIKTRKNKRLKDDYRKIKTMFNKKLGDVK